MVSHPASWTNVTAGYECTSQCPLTIADVGPNGTTQSDFSSIQLTYAMYPTDNNLVLGDNGAAFVTDGLNIAAFNVTTLQTLWTYSSQDYVSFVAATSGGGVAINDSQQGVIQLDSTGTPGTPVANLQGATPFNLVTPVSDSPNDLGLWGEITARDAAMAAGPEENSASEFSRPTGALDGQRSAAAPATPVNFRQVLEDNWDDGTLYFEYNYDSSSGRQPDLATCRVGEFVVLPAKTGHLI